MVAVAASFSAQLAFAAAPAVVADDRDQWTLLYRHPANRQLFEQIAVPKQGFRLGPRQGFITALADVNIGTQQVLDASEQSRYHGWFLANTYVGVRPLTGLDVNLNLLMLNPSASDGYRLSSSVHPGLTLHLSRELFQLAHHPVRVDVLGTDLGWVTSGNGLLLESVPLEGVLGLVRWKDWEFRYMSAGRAYFTDDDYASFGLSALARKVQIQLSDWQIHDPPQGVLAPMPAKTPDASQLGAYAMGHAYHATLATHWPITHWLRVATEFGYRIQQQPRVGILGRVDVMPREQDAYAVHLGYQFRYYQAGFGPRERLITPSWAFNSMLQQDAYVTNPFEYLGISPAYDQWSHTIMGEGRARIGFGFEIYANTELWVRYARAATLPRFAVHTANGFRAPGQATQWYYHAGLRYYPWPNLPHRASLSATNKQVQAAWVATHQVERRFAPGNFWVLTLEAYL